jgi:acetolactate synthase-1/2/3 large subunit
MNDAVTDAPTAARFVLKALAQEGIRHVFMVPGGLIDDFLPAFEGSGVTPIVAAHEAGAGFMADGYARATLRFGACLAQGGPGVANLAPALASAYADKIPILALSGEVPSDWEGRGAFQDSAVPDLRIMRPITAFGREVPVVGSVAHDLQVALRNMTGTRQRPVFLSLPQQLQTQKVTDPYPPPNVWVEQPPRVLDIESFESARDKLVSVLKAGGFKIAILAGNGAVRSGATRDLLDVAEAYSIPVATTLRAKGVVAENHAASFGNFGYGGTRWSTVALTPQDDPAKPDPGKYQADVLLILGTTLTQRDTLYRKDPGLPKVTIQVDIDPSAFNRNYPVTMPVVGDVGTFLRWMLNPGPEVQALRTLLTNTAQQRETWANNDIKESWPRYYHAEDMQSDAVPIHPARVVAELQKAAPADLRLVVDSGAHRPFVGHYWDSFAPLSYFTATTMAPMGWAVAAAVGVKLAQPSSPVAVVTGDACMLMHGMEIQTAARYGLPIVYVVINNAAHGNVWLGLNQLYGPGTAALAELPPPHDFLEVAKALRADGEVVTDPAKLAQAFANAFEATSRHPIPYVVDVRCDKAFATPIDPWRNAVQSKFD